MNCLKAKFRVKFQVNFRHFRVGKLRSICKSYFHTLTKQYREAKYFFNRWIMNCHKGITSHCALLSCYYLQNIPKLCSDGRNHQIRWEKSQVLIRLSYLLTDVVMLTFSKAGPGLELFWKYVKNIDLHANVLPCVKRWIVPSEKTCFNLKRVTRFGVHW